MPNEIKIIEDGQPTLFSNPKIAEFRQINTEPHPFGESAKAQGQSPITMRVNFTDGNSVKFRGDLKTPYVNIMLSNLSDLLKSYIFKKKVKDAIIYDNRPEAFSKIVLKWEESKITQNLLPIYISNYKLK